jgi:hypothetical protein
VSVELVGLTLMGENTAETPPRAATVHFVRCGKAEYGLHEPMVWVRSMAGRGGEDGGEGTYPSSERTLRRVSGRSRGAPGSLCERRGGGEALPSCLCPSCRAGVETAFRRGGPSTWDTPV